MSFTTSEDTSSVEFESENVPMDEDTGINKFRNMFSDKINENGLTDSTGLSP